MPRVPRFRRPKGALLGALVAMTLAFPLGVLASHQFDDVPNSHDFHADIDAIADAGVTQGCDANSYCPNDFVTRGQMAAFLNRLGALQAGKTPVVNAATAQKTDGWSLGCPSGTTWSQGLCFENATRNPLSVYSAADACAGIGFIGGWRYRLPTVHQLRSARSVLTLDVGGEHTDSLFSEWDGDSNATMSYAVFDNGLFDHVIGGTTRRFRCVTPPQSVDLSIILPPAERERYPDAVAPVPNEVDASGLPVD